MDPSLDRRGETTRAPVDDPAIIQQILADLARSRSEDNPGPAPPVSSP